MKFDVDDKNICPLVCAKKFHLNRCRFAVAVAKCLGAHFFGTQCIDLVSVIDQRLNLVHQILESPVLMTLY